MNKAIVTGATGFIGSWLLEELLHNGVHVTVLLCDSLENINENIRDRINIVQYSPNNIFDIKEKVGYDFDVFYNIGWGGVSPEKKNDLDLQLSNIKSSLDAVLFANQIRCSKFVGIGTVAEYVYCNGAISSAEPPSPSDLYGAAKVAAHFMSEAYAEQLGQPFIWTILCSTYGERRNDDNLISYTIKTLLAGEKPTFTKLEQMWDFMHVSDVVNALYLIGEKGIEGKTYGIGSGIYRPLREYIQEIHKLIDNSLLLGIGERQYPIKKIPSSCVDSTELVNDTGFMPRMSFEDGIIHTISYFKERLE